MKNARFAIFFFAYLVTAVRSIEFDWSIANITVALSANAYCPDIKTSAESDPRCTGFKFTKSFRNDRYDVVGYAGYSSLNRAIYVIFRGSESITNWLDGE